MHKGTPLVLRDTALRLPKQAPPWDIEGEPGGPKFFTLKRPFKAGNKGEDAGHTGHHRSQSCHTKTPSVSPAPQIPHHSPRVCTHYHDVALKLLEIVILRPIERACNWKRKWQCAATSTWQHITPRSHMQHVQLHTSYAGHIPSCAC